MINKEYKSPNIINPSSFSEEDVHKMFCDYKHNKNNRLRNKLAVRNQALVTFIINKYYSAKMQHQVLRDDLLQEGNIGLLSAIDGFDPDKGFKFSTYACVPLTTEILTRRGWKKYNELVDGDETIGYNNGRSEWTKINGVKTYDNAPLVKFGDSKWNAICTDQHKWLIAEDDEVKLRPLTEWPTSKQYEWPTKVKQNGKSKYVRRKTHLITSAPFVGGLSKLTSDEAALLAWIFSDGSLVGGRTNPTSAVIIQSPKKFTKEIRDLLVRLDAYNSDTKHGDCLAFNIKSSVFRKIWNKSNLSNCTLSELVLELSPKARKAWFDAWYMAEGTLGRNHISQNKGEKLDALELCVFLEGKYGVKTVEKNKIKPTKCSYVSWHSKPRNPRRCVVKPHGEGPVWCPNTDLGSWTARTSDGHVFLTGNTWWIRQAINNYLINTEPTIHVPPHVKTAQNKLMRKLKEENMELQEMIHDYSSNQQDFPLTNNMMRNINLAMNTRTLKSLEEEVMLPDASKATLKDLVETKEKSADQKIDRTIVINNLKESFKKLSPKEKLILLLRYNVINNEEVPLLCQMWKKQEELK